MTEICSIIHKYSIYGEKNYMNLDFSSPISEHERDHGLAGYSTWRHVKIVTPADRVTLFALRKPQAVQAHVLSKKRKIIPLKRHALCDILPNVYKKKNLKISKSVRPIQGKDRKSVV